MSFYSGTTESIQLCCIAVCGPTTGPRHRSLQHTAGTWCCFNASAPLRYFHIHLYRNCFSSFSGGSTVMSDQDTLVTSNADYFKKVTQQTHGKGSEESVMLLLVFLISICQAASLCFRNSSRGVQLCSNMHPS